MTVGRRLQCPGPSVNLLHRSGPSCLQLRGLGDAPSLDETLHELLLLPTGREVLVTKLLAHSTQRAAVAPPPNHRPQRAVGRVAPCKAGGVPGGGRRWCTATARPRRGGARRASSHTDAVRSAPPTSRGRVGPSRPTERRYVPAPHATDSRDRPEQVPGGAPPSTRRKPQAWERAAYLNGRTGSPRCATFILSHTDLASSGQLDWRYISSRMNHAMKSDTSW